MIAVAVLRWQRAAILGALLLCCAAAAAQQAGSVTVAGDRERVSLIAEDVSLRQAIDYLAWQQGLVVVAYTPLEQKVSLQTRERPLRDVLRRLLQHYSFTLQLNANGGRLWIYPRDDDDATRLGTPLRLGRNSKHGTQAGGAGEMSAWGTVSSMGVLLDALNDPRVEVRLEAAIALAEAHGDEAVPALARLLGDREERVATAAMESLADIGSEAAVAELGRLLQSGDAAIRLQVVDLLADIDGASATRLLQQAMSDPEPQVQAQAREYLAERDTGSRSGTQ